MKPQSIDDQLKNIASSVDLQKPMTDKKLAGILAQFKSNSPRSFENRISDIRHVKDGVSSEMVKRLLSDCENVTLAAIQQYHQQLFWLSQYLYREFEHLQRLGTEARDFSDKLGSLKIPDQTVVLAEVSEAIEYFRESLSVGVVDQNEVCDLCVLIASDLFDKILPIDNTAAHIETARDALWTTISTFSTLGLLEYTKVAKRANPSQRRNLDLRGGDPSIVFYETYYDAMVDWGYSSKAWQLRIEMELRQKGASIAKQD